MADDRSTSGSRGPSDEVHDDDELADVLAAELQRYATGAVPVVVRDTAPPPAPPRPPARVEETRREAAARALLDAPSAPLRPREPGRRAVQRAAEPADGAPSAFQRRRPDLRRLMQDAAPVEPGADTAEMRAVPPAAARVEDAPRGPAADRLLPDPMDEVPIRRRTGFRPPAVDVSPPPPTDPMDRVLPTGPVVLPESTATLLEEMIADSGDDRAGMRSARHASPPALVEPTPTAPTALGRVPGPVPSVEEPDPLTDALRATGPLAVPRPLYSDWEQSLRSIGRPRSPWGDDDSPLVGGAPPDAPTVAMPVLRDAPAADPVRYPAEAPSPDAPTGRIRRSGRRRAAVESLPSAVPPVPEPLQIDADPAVDDDGVDDVSPLHPRISAATTGAVDLPITGPRPRTAPVFVERVRTAILQLPVVPESPTGSGGPAIAGRWIGAFASPLVLLVAFGVAGAGGGPAAAVLALAGVLAAAPAAARSAAWAAAAGPGQREEAQVLGGVAGTVWAVVLLLARIAAAALATFAVASLVAAWAARTGALGGSAADAAVLAGSAVGLAALLVAALPVRATGVVVQVLAAFGATATVLFLLLLAPTTAAGSPAPSGVVVGAAAGFAAIGLVLVLCVADVARWRTDLSRPRTAAVGVVVGAVTGAAVLVLGVLVAAGAAGDPADAFAGALSDGSAVDLATPLGVVLIATAVVLPILLLRSAGGAAARLIGGSERLGILAAGLLAVAGALGLLAAGADPTVTAIAAGGLVGVPVAAWAGLRTLGRRGGGRPVVAAGTAVAVLVGWALADGLLPGATSPVLGALGPAAAVLRGGPSAGLAAAFLIGLAAGALARRDDDAPPVPVRDPADTVEG